MKKITVLLALLVTVVLAGAAYAHPDHEDEAPVTLYKVALEKKKNGASFSVSRDDQKVATTGATGKLIVIRGKAKEEVALKPSGEYGMTTAKSTALPAGTRARAMITFADGTSAVEDFVLP